MKIARKLLKEFLEIQPIKMGKKYHPGFEPTFFEYPSYLIFDTVGSGFKSYMVEIPVFVRNKERHLYCAYTADSVNRKSRVTKDASRAKRVTYKRLVTLLVCRLQNLRAF